MFIGRGGTGWEAVTWAVSRDGNAENETDRVKLQYHGKLKSGIDLCTYSNVTNNLTCSMLLISGKKKKRIVPRPLVYSNVLMVTRVCLYLFVCFESQI